MSINVRPYVVGVTHVEGCKKKRCGPKCKRKTDGYEVDIEIVYPDGSREPRKRVRSPMTSYAASEAWAKEYEEEKLGKWREQKHAIVKKEVPTVGAFQQDFINYCKANRQKPSTIYAKRSILRKHILPLVGTKRLDEITDTDVMTLKAKLTTKNAKTVNNVLTVMTKMLKVAKRMGKLDEIPVDVELLKVPPSPFSFYDYEEFDRLVNAAEKLDPRILVTVLLSGDAGLRPGETVGLEQSDVKWVRRPVLTIQRQVWWGQVGSPKNGRSRNIRMTGKLAAALTSIRHLRGERFLYQDNGRPVTQKVLRRWLANAQRLAGLKVTGNLYTLRHTFCSHHAMAGSSVLAIKEMAGHKHLSTTMRYMHLSPNHMDEAVVLLERKRARFGDGLETEESQ